MSYNIAHGSGGAVYVQGGGLTIDRSTLLQNAAVAPAIVTTAVVSAALAFEARRDALSER